VADDDRVGERPAASLAEPLRRMCLDQRFELGVELALLAADVGDPFQHGCGDCEPEAVRQPPEPARDLGTALRTVERTRLIILGPLQPARLGT
jgi:hypothetical protein